MSPSVFEVTKVTPHYWRATINQPPFNLAGSNFFVGLWNPLQEAEAESDLKILVFDSAIPDFFISHYNLQQASSISPELLAKWPLIMLKLATISVITVAAIRGRARGIGSEFVLASDVRFGRNEKAILSRAEVNFGLIPGGDGIELLPSPCRAVGCLGLFVIAMNLMLKPPQTMARSTELCQMLIWMVSSVNLCTA